ncbi:MAG: hypothetical protein QNJ31_07935 [Candidatus Caenarcaniphilales bacterium]|nr:hypothetical protein [Candidatus Caenarcaniphilales bacterium]
MSSGSHSRYSRQPSNKTGQIVGASLSNNSSNGKQKKSLNKDSSQKISSIAPSEEFKVFWGNNVDASWFEGKRIVSPFIIFITFLVILSIYLCINLLFAPGELREVFTSPSSDYDMSVLDSKISNLQTVDDEKMLFNSIENKPSEGRSKKSKLTKNNLSKSSSSQAKKTSQDN